jgi:hypothetical protein
MRKTWITLAVMLAITAALAGWIRLHPARESAPAQRLSTLTPAVVHALTVEWRGRRTFVLERQGRHWRIVQPFAARADALETGRILSLLGAPADTVLPATGLDRYGLAAPERRIVADGQTYALGAINPVTGEAYVLTRDRVYVLPARFAASVPADPGKLIDKQLLADDETPTAFAFPKFSVRQQGGRWITDVAGQPGEDDLMRWVEGWRLASALRAEHDASEPEGEHISIALRDGRHVAIGVRERDGELIFTRYDEHVRYYFTAKSAQRLLAPPSPSGRAILGAKPK